MYHANPECNILPEKRRLGLIIRYQNENVSSLLELEISGLYTCTCTSSSVVVAVVIFIDNLCLDYITYKLIIENNYQNDDLFGFRF